MQMSSCYFIGSEKKVMLVLGGSMFFFMIIFKSIIAMVFIFIVFTILYKLAVYLNKKDPKFFTVYLRYRKYKKLYKPRSNVFAHYISDWRVRN